jgi:threonyl-tRNA synthetase
VPSTGRLKHFKLLNAGRRVLARRLKRQMLQRIYGTAWFTKEDLERTCTGWRRRSGATTAARPRAGPLPSSTRSRPAPRSGRRAAPRSTTSWATGCASVLRERLPGVKTPLLFNKGLWEQSGHWGKYRENMFLVLDSETGEHDFSLKPMNCPSHHLMYAAKKHSYRELPIRYATQDVLHRNEVSGALSG